MNKNIFCGIECQSTVLPLKFEVVDGVTWLCPDRDSGVKSYRLELTALIDNILIDFFDLGEFLEDQLGEKDYIPIYFDEDFMENLLERKKGPLTGNHPFLDETSPFLSSNPELTANRILDFFRKYGMISVKTLQDWFGIAIRVVIEHFGEEARDISKRIPVSYLAYCIYEIYLRFTNPEKYVDLIIKHPPRHRCIAGSPDNRNWPVTIESHIEIKVVYRHGQGWEEKKVIHSVLDLIAIFLFYDETRHIRKCKYCGKVFVSPLASAVYCSASCRNCANSKKSYERRKAKERGQL